MIVASNRHGHRERPGGSRQSLRKGRWQCDRLDGGMGLLIDSAARRIRRQANWLSIVLVAVVGWIGSDAPAAPPEPLRPASLDSQGSEVPAGWTAIDRTVFDAYAAAAGRGEAGPSAGGIEHCDYRLKLLPDGSISGEARGRFKLLGSPAYIAAGQPSFALTDLSVDEKPVVWGTDSHGLTLIHCPRQDASFSCRISQRGIRRGESIEFPLTWLTSIATQLELTIPAGQMVESSGLLKTSEIARADGSRTISFQAGARSSSVLRCLPEERSSSRPFGVELRQTVSASVTKVVIQSTIGLVSQSTGPAAAEIDVPAGFTLVKVTLADSERLILTPDSDGRIRVPLGELAAGQRVELRLGMERPANWNSPLDVPRVAPKNGVVLREEWILQVEKPLEITSVDAPSFVQTALQDESAREVWTFRGNDRNGSLTVTARAPAPEWSADCFIRGRQKGSRNEVLALIDLKSSRGPLYEFEIDIQKPWKLVSATSRDAAGATNPLSFSPVHETEGAVRYRVLLRNAVTPQSGVPITLTAATQVQAGPNQTLIGVVSPHGGAVQNFLVQTVDSLPPGVDSEVGPAVPVNSLRSAVRGSAFFDNLRLETLSIHRRIASPAGDRQAASQSPVFDPEKASAATPSDRDSAVALKDATAIGELQTTLGGAGEPASNHAWFVFDRAVDVSDAVIRLGGEWTLIDIRCDGRLMRVLSIPGEIHFPKHSSAVREIEITWSSPASPESIQRRDSVHWPQLEASILRWTWKIDSPQERRVTAIDGPFEVEGGLSRPSLRERLLAPLGRTRNQPIFNPFLVHGWRELFWQPARDMGSHSESAPVVAAGRHYPELTAVVSWSSQVLYWLGWVTLLGSMFLIAVLRRFKRRTFRLAAIITGLTATAAWLVPAPYGSMAGAAFCGSLFAFVLPRRLLLTVPAVALQPRSSIVRLAGASVILLAIVPDTASPVPPESPAITPNVLMSSDEMKVYVAEPIAKEIAEWQRRQSGPSYLIRDARYEISVDDSELASASLRFDVIVADPVATRSIQLPFEGLTLKGPDAATMNGLPVRLIPAADGSGVILPVPQLAGVVRAAELEVKLDATLRVLRSGSRREMAMALPRCIAAAATVNASDGTLFDFKSTARGAMERRESSVTSWLGSVTRWQARWRSEAAAQPASDATVTAGAQSVVLAESESLRIHTRLTVESPELPDPFAATRLSVRLPSQSLVSSVSGENLIRWRLHTEDAGITVLLDLAAPPIVGQQFDLEYELPIDLSSAITLPPIPLVANSVGGHQIAVIAPSTYRVEILSKPDPIAGLWSIEPAAASMSLRKDRGDPPPSAAADLERPQPLLLSLSRRPTGRSVELEQSLVPAAESIAWTGTARIETSIRPGFLYEFHVDPAIEIQAVTVLERDVERPSRFLRNGERLLLIVKDDRLGTKNVRLDGKLQLEAGKVRPVPLFELNDASVSRREIIITSSLDQMLQIRRNESTAIVPGRADSEWEPSDPSTRRVALPGERAPFVLRWINPASPLNVVEFLRLPDRGDPSTLVEWKLEAAQQFPASLFIDAPANTQIAECSDFSEEAHLPLPGDRVSIELQSRSNRSSTARLQMIVPAGSTTAGAALLPRLADLSVRPVTYLAVPRSLLPLYDVPGDFLDQLPLSAPVDWSAAFADRSLLVFRLAGETWAPAKEAAGTLGNAMAEIVAAQSDAELHGQTRWIVNPARVGLLRIERPDEGTLNSVQCTSDSSVSPMENGVWEVLLRPSQPMAICADWSRPVDGAASSADLASVGPRAVGLAVDVTYASTILAPEKTGWTPEILARPAGMDLLATVRLTNLLQAARLLPIGARPPAWLRDELLDLGRAFRGSPQAGHLSVQVESLLDSWSRTSKFSSLHSVAPDAALVQHDSQRLLADSMFVAAADPDNSIAVPAGHSTWSISRRLFNGGFATAWFIFWSFVITKGGQWARQNELADRVAQRPAIVLFTIGVAWWLLLSPSSLGVMIAVTAVLWEAVSVVRRRRLRSALPSQ